MVCLITKILLLTFVVTSSIQTTIATTTISTITKPTTILNNNTTSYVQQYTTKIKQQPTTNCSNTTFTSNKTINFFNCTTNYNNDTTKQPLPPRLPHQKNILWEVFQFLCFGFLFVIGVTGNYLIVSTIIRDKSMHNLQNSFVFSLAMTDFIALLIVLPLNVIMKYVSWPFGEFTCKYVLPIGDVVPPVSILTLVATSVDRYRAIVYALLKPPSLTQGICAILLLWIATYLILGLPLTFVFVVGRGHWVEKTCYAVWKDKETELTYITARGILFYVIPSIVIFHCYARVTTVLQRNLKFLSRSASGFAQVVRLKRQKRVMNMFFAIFVCFFVCFLPFNLLTILMLNSTAIGRWQYAGEVFQITVLIAFANSVCNPIILYKLSRGYRDSFQKSLSFLKYFSKCCQRRHEETVDIDDTVTVNHKIRFSRRRSTKESHIVSFLSSPKLHRGSSAIGLNDEASEAEMSLVNNCQVIGNHLSPSPTQRFLSPNNLK